VVLIYTNNGAMTLEDAIRAGKAQADQMEAGSAAAAGPHGTGTSGAPGSEKPGPVAGEAPPL